MLSQNIYKYRPNQLNISRKQMKKLNRENKVFFDACSDITYSTGVFVHKNEFVRHMLSRATLPFG